MDNFTKLGNTSATNNERENNDVKQMDEFLNKASTITINSTSMELCGLIAEIYSYLQQNGTSIFRGMLMELYHLLSDCISCKYNLTNEGFIKLQKYVEEQRSFLEESHFI